MVLMDNLYIHPTDYTPEVVFDADSGILRIEGESYHEQSMVFYQPIISWLRDYLSQTDLSVEMHFKISYFNTLSSRRFIEILELFEGYDEKHKGQIKIFWHYNTSDVDMLESGKEFANETYLAFDFVPV